MSGGGALVRFADGSIKVTEYRGTSDTLDPALRDDWDDPAPTLPPWYERATEPVTIWTNYGGGFWWEGRATRERVKPSSCCPMGIEGRTGWVIAPVTIHDGTPDWAEDEARV